MRHEVLPLMQCCNTVHTLTKDEEITHASEYASLPGAPQFAAPEIAADEIAAKNWPPWKTPTI